MVSQVHSREERADGGLGIGLSLVRTLVAMHGGSVAAFSEGPVRGSAFTVRLPFSTSSATMSTASPDADAAYRPTERDGRRILVVEMAPTRLHR